MIQRTIPQNLIAIVVMATSPAKWQTFTRMVGAFIITAVAWIMLGIVVRATAFAGWGGLTFGLLSADLVGWRHVRSLKDRQ